MKIFDIKLENLKEYENNPRHNEKAVDVVANSIAQFGFKVPIVVDKNNVIVCGHTRAKAARVLGLDTVPCIVADDLTPEQIDAFRLADNKTSEFADWDFSKLDEELAKLADVEFDMSDFGFDIDDGKDPIPVEEGSEGTGSASEKGYAITYEIAFNDEQEQQEWYNFLSALRKKYPDVDTIAERILIAVRDWMDSNG